MGSIFLKFSLTKQMCKTLWARYYVVLLAGHIIFLYMILLSLNLLQYSQKCYCSLSVNMKIDFIDVFPSIRREFLFQKCILKWFTNYTRNFLQNYFVYFISFNFSSYQIPDAIMNNFANYSLYFRQISLILFLLSFDKILFFIFN